jgi:site-specific DNA-methyltransferase (adenine-specific)
LRERNPDVLTSIANLSNDEVFTPPTFANQMLDTIATAWADSNDGANIWADKNVRFLDPFTKSGVFLREIVRRLSEGLEKEIPDLQDRINHIVSKQVFGMAITQLTALTTRRSVYCSKRANGKHSIATIFNDEEGSIWFKRTEHSWTGGAQKVLTVDENGKEIEKKLGGKCKHCGASQSEYERDKTLESHAYALIHTEDPKQLIKEVFGEEMQFDVIIGNPPYQLNDAGNNASSSPIYHDFVSQAKKLEPRFLSMVIPSRWFAGGKGLDSFRDEMLNDRRIRFLADYFDSSKVFPGVDISGGICYFVWNRDSEGDCEISTTIGERTETASRPLLLNGHDTFIRFHGAISVLKKIEAAGPVDFGSKVSPRKPFGLATNVAVREKEEKGDLFCYAYPKNGYISKNAILKNIDWIEKYKVFSAKAYGERGNFPYLVTGKPFVGKPGSCSLESYIVIRATDTAQEAANIAQYMTTKFFRFLVLLKKNTQNAAGKVYDLVPDQDFSVTWTDELLYTKYKLTKDEILLIDSLVRPMEFKND